MAGLENLKIYNRTCNVLQRNDITTVEQLKTMTDEAILRLPGVGKKALKDIRAALAPDSATTLLLGYLVEEEANLLAADERVSICLKVVAKHEARVCNLKAALKILEEAL